MQELPVAKVAEILGISKEAVYNRLRRGTLQSVERDGEKLVIIEPTKSTKQTSKKTTNPKNNESQAPIRDEFVEFLIGELAELKSQNQQLLEGKERLFKEKEQMLIDSKNEISAIYKDRDEKLMAFLSALKNPNLSSPEPSKKLGENLLSEPVIEAQIDDMSEKKWASIDEFLDGLGLKDKERKKTQKQLIKQINSSKFIKFKKGVILVRRDKNLKEIIGE